MGGYINGSTNSESSPREWFKEEPLHKVRNQRATVQRRNDCSSLFDVPDLVPITSSASPDLALLSISEQAVGEIEAEACEGHC